MRSRVCLIVLLLTLMSFCTSQLMNINHTPYQHMNHHVNKQQTVLRPQRRRRNRPRPRQLRALPLHLPNLRPQHHHRQNLPQGNLQGTSRRLPRQNRPSSPAHHQRNPRMDRIRVQNPRGRPGQQTLGCRQRR
jgi:hypothetical protein